MSRLRRRRGGARGGRTASSRARLVPELESAAAGAARTRAAATHLVRPSRDVDSGYFSSSLDRSVRVNGCWSVSNAGPSSVCVKSVAPNAISPPAGQFSRMRHR